MSNRITSQQARAFLQAAASEAEIQAAILEYLAAMKIPHTITNAALSYNGRGQIVRRITPGWPDITAVAPGGAALMIEVKSAIGKLRPEQARTLHALYRAGALIVIARSIDDVAEALRTGKVRARDMEELKQALAKVD